MSKHNRNSNIVFSTREDFEPLDENTEDIPQTLPPSMQRLIIRLDKKQRKGKKVTLVEGFVGGESDLKELGKLLKSKCGVGGSEKNGEIIIQGDFREKIKSILEEMSYKCKISG
jgi:translation initiation factor 1